MLKRIVSLSIAMVMLVTASTGCSNKNKNENDKPVIYTSFYAIYDFTKRIAGDKIDVQNIISPGVEAHHWEPSASDIKKLETADMLIINGVGFEGWVDKITTSLSNKELQIIDTSKDVELIEVDSGETHSHDDHDEHDDEHDHSHGEYDPHIWTSLNNAIKQMENIKDALSAFDEENKDYYEANFNEQKEKFLELDAEFKIASENFEPKTLIVSHKAFGYLCKDYNLEQIALRGISAENEPDAGTLAEIVKTIREKNVNSIFYEEFINPKVSETVANEVGAKLYVLSPAETISQEQIENGEDYLTVMRKNLETLKEALS